ncbi:hypothetical protein KSP39_PZI005760 [Platanthera zijinensis]|uniref:Uncharacterized protein n=1 Tax=Platanthera zijinensis TaxID=2320716 RepID=A0AAP0BUU9_9ASPA
MEELKVADIAVQTLLKLTLAIQMGNGCVIRRTTVKVVVGELQSRREKLEKTLSQLEQKIGELYRLIVALRMSILGYLSDPHILLMIILRNINSICKFQTKQQINLPNQKSVSIFYS